MKLAWHPKAWDEYVDWQSEDRKMLKRINLLIKDLQRGEGDGIGKPNRSKGDLAGWASRRINEEHRLVIRINDAKDELEILPPAVTTTRTVAASRPNPAPATRDFEQTLGLLPDVRAGLAGYRRQ